MFVLSKIISALADPIMLTVVAVLAATVLLFTRLWRLGRGLLVAVSLALVAVSALPWDAWLVAPLEDRFPQSPPIGHVDGIVVLGGALNPVVSAARGQPSAGGAVERVTVLAELTRRHPGARIIFTGGSGAVLDQVSKEAPVASDFLNQIGVNTASITFEDQSRNTRENALFSRDLMHPKQGETWLLVTSALHMPRSVGTFRAAGWEVVPYPVDYLTTGRRDWSFGFSPGSGFAYLSSALHEWQGLVYYRLRGWTGTLLPGPADGV